MITTDTKYGYDILSIKYKLLTINYKLNYDYHQELSHIMILISAHMEQKLKSTQPICLTQKWAYL